MASTHAEPGPGLPSPSSGHPKCQLPAHDGTSRSRPLSQSHGRSSNTPAKARLPVQAGLQHGAMPGGYPHAPAQLLLGTMPTLGIPQQPRLQIPGQSGNTGQEPQAGFGKRCPRSQHHPCCRSRVIPELTAHPPLSCPSQHPARLPCPALPAFPRSTLARHVLHGGSAATTPAPTTAPLHPGGCGGASGTSASREPAMTAAASPALPGFVRCHNLAPQPRSGPTGDNKSSSTAGSQEAQRFPGASGVRPGGPAKVKPREAVCKPRGGQRGGRERVNGARPSRALLGRPGRAGR